MSDSIDDNGMTQEEEELLNGIFFEEYDDLDVADVGDEGAYVGAGGVVALVSAIRIL